MPTLSSLPANKSWLSCPLSVSSERIATIAAEQCFGNHSNDHRHCRCHRIVAFGSRNVGRLD